MSNLDGFIKQFLAESYENLDKLDRTLVELEKDPRAADKLAGIFRIVHSLKGTAAFFGFAKLEALTHAGEGLLARLRDGALLLNAEITSGLLSMVDAVRQMLSNVEKTGGEGSESYSAVLQRLTSLYGSSSPGPTKQALPSPAEKTPLGGAAAPRLGELLVEANVIQEKDVAEVLSEQLNGDPRLVGEILVEHGLVKSEDVVDALNKQSQAQSSSTVSNIRIDVEHLDKLMNLAGELVLARNQILQFSSAHQDAGLTSATQRLNLITTELQEGIMKARMQPIENIWSKFPRVVRDLAALFNKKVRLEMEGSDTELDRTIIEAIRDPLTHLVRNCVDHGIESPEKRAASGKPIEGRLLLRAFHEGGQVNIEISDDGAGIDARRLKRKAVELSLISSEQVQRLDERAAMNLIFLPGFSTADKVTAVSGRGVGMDVVKTNIEKIGGMVEVESKLGAGTTLKIRIPLTLAIIPALIVTSGGQRYAIPQTSVLELVRLAAEKATKGIETIHGAPVYRLRENLLPLVYLNRELEISTAPAAGVQHNGAPAKAVTTNIVVLQADQRKFGLVVDEVNDTGEIVVKPLGKRLKGISIFAGATIMGDGRVALILDVAGLARNAHVLSQTSVQKQVETKASSQRAKEDRQSLLLFTTAHGSHMVIPLSQVTRLEEFPPALLEWTGDHEMVQYQGQILPLVDLNSLLPGRQTATDSSATGDTIKVVVYSSKDRRVGLKIGRIIDIIEDQLLIQHPSSRRGSLGSVVIHGRIAEVVDMNEILALEAVNDAMSAAAIAGKSQELVS